MNHEYFEKFSDMAKKAQEPLQDLVELNIKTAQSVAYLKPEELAKIKKPEELFEKQVELAVENSKKALDYLEKSMKIMEKSMHVALDESKKAAKDK